MHLALISVIFNEIRNLFNNNYLWITCTPNFRLWNFLKKKKKKKKKSSYQYTDFLAAEFTPNLAFVQVFISL